MNRIQDYSKLADSICHWLREYTENASMSGLVVGVSGGIDSAVVSTLCALTGIPTYICSIAIRSNQQHLDLAREHMEWLEQYKTSSHYFNLDNALIEMVRAIPFDNKHGWANTKSRMRMVTLYQVAATVNGLVVGTGNKVEDYGTKFFSKHGDGGVDFNPIGDLYKTEVRELGRHLGVNSKILNAHPTDGLWEDHRTDEDQIGATYEELEWVMEWDRIDQNLTPRQWEVVRIYDRLYHAGMHKMIPIPVYKLDI